MIREHDKVVLTVALSDHGLEPGDVGVVVHIYPSQEAYEIEFVTLTGQAAARSSLLQPTKLAWW
jgi:hypothetical protein